MSISTFDVNCVLPNIRRKKDCRLKGYVMKVVMDSFILMYFSIFSIIEVVED